MFNENTPLTRGLNRRSGSDDMPNDSGRQNMFHFQLCICMIIITILLIAVIIVLAYGNVWTDSPVFLLAKTENDTDAFIIISNLSILNTLIQDEPENKWALEKFKLNKFNNETAVNAGIKALGDREILEEMSEITPINTPAFRHYRSLSTNREARILARRGYVEDHATQHLAKAFNYTKRAGRSNIGLGPKISLPDHTLNFTCDFNRPYRTANGICNNKKHPRTYGAALIPYRRMVAPDYADGVSLPRASHSGNPLPSPREVSLKIHRSSYETDSNFTVMLAVFGQFLDHDITATSLSVSQEGESINCCTNSLIAHPECLAVPIGLDDPHYGAFNVTCMNFVRSAAAPTGHFGPRQQLNQATSFIDASVVYGSTEEVQHNLRTHKNGTLRMFQTENGRQLLPISTNMNDGCNREHMASIGRYCFEAGDDRSNENLLLTSMHLLFARQHNYLARGLQEVNSEWDDEQLFQEARKILGAQMAYITYNEFLPILVGRDLAEKKGLLPEMKTDLGDDVTIVNRYDESIDPTIANSFAAAAFRFAHTLLPGLFNMTSNDKSFESVQLHKMLFNPFSLWPERGIDHAIQSAINTPVKHVDRFFSPEVTQKLFEGFSEERVPLCGLDLVSLNIQRGRDHGLPSYPVFRSHCKLPKVDTWEEMAQAIEPSSLKSIQEIYASPYDVDVYTGALSEPPLKGAIFGPLLTCLVSDQFLRLKRGDSHWYERKIGPSKFTKHQLDEIYKTSLAGIICQNGDFVERVPQYVMEYPAKEIIDCNQIGSINFKAWLASEPSSKLHRTSVAVEWKKVRMITNTTHAPEGVHAQENS